MVWKPLFILTCDETWNQEDEISLLDDTEMFKNHERLCHLIFLTTKTRRLSMFMISLICGHSC
jgi:hypothetical protein